MVENRIYKFLVCLNKELNKVRGKVAHGGPLPSLKEVLTQTQRQETRRGVKLGKKGAGMTKKKKKTLLMQNITRPYKDKLKRLERILADDLEIKDLETLIYFLGT